VSAACIEATLVLLREVERYASSPDQLNALEVSRSLLHFIMGRSASTELQEFIKHAGTAALTPLFVFSTQEEADAWLLKHPAPPHGAIIRAADDFYTVAHVRALDHRKLLHLPPVTEALADSEEGEEEQEGTEESVPPAPQAGTESSFFELYNWTCYHLHVLEKQLTSPALLDAIKMARRAFDFVMRMGEERGFEDYLEAIRSVRTATPLKSFLSQEAAVTWLMAEPGPLSPAAVVIGNELYATGYDHRRGQRVLTLIPTQPAPTR
jgi:hypothetical protein